VNTIPARTAHRPPRAKPYQVSTRQMSVRHRTPPPQASGSGSRARRCCCMPLPGETVLSPSVMILPRDTLFLRAAASSAAASAGVLLRPRDIYAFRSFFRAAKSRYARGAGRALSPDTYMPSRYRRARRQRHFRAPPQPLMRLVSLFAFCRSFAIRLLPADAMTRSLRGRYARGHLRRKSLRFTRAL